MPDHRQHRGPHPKDRELFAPAQHEALRLAVAELSWLYTRGYAAPSALKLVGDRHRLVARQRLAVRRAACGDDARERRRRHCVSLADAGSSPLLGVDGYNALITVEAALSGAVVVAARDGSRRDLASTHGTYRKVEETGPALLLIAAELARHGVQQLEWFLDRPVSNSGLLRRYIREVLADWPGRLTVELVDNPDRVLAAYPGVVVSSDSWILDRCSAWTNLVAAVVDRSVPAPWIVDLA